MFSVIAASLASVSGSSFATVMAVGLTGAASALGNRTELRPADLPVALESALKPILDLGQVARGDKTVIDGLYAAKDALSDHIETANRSQLVAAVREAVIAEIEQMRERPFRVGRGRVYGKRGRGMDDLAWLRFSTVSTR